MALDPGNAAIPLIIGVGIANSFTAFTTFTPSLTELRTSTDGADAADLRHGEVCALIVGGGVALMVSLLTNNAMPLLTSLALLAILTIMYEYTYRSVS